ncbi:hypothetical protein [Dishui Lake phycodnavirus 4]|nr:hypothetical protein [Dishui Lake phycodnavirus 4]
MSGTLKLATRGVQDAWFTENPEVSQFLIRYKRHSKFSMEQVELPFDGTKDFGKELLCDIPYSKGDILRNVALRITINDVEDSAIPETLRGRNILPSYTQLINIPYVPSLCTELVEYADLYIGGQFIERLTGEYIYMHQQLTNTDNDVKRALVKMNGHGNFIDLYDDDALDDVYKIVGASGPQYLRNNYNTYILDIPFYFYRSPSLSIPLCALSKQMVQIRIKLKTLNDIIFGGLGPTMYADLQRISLEATFGFLEDTERHFLMSRPIDYVITQLQLAQFTMAYPETKKIVQLNFKNPVKELFFICQNDAYTQFKNPNRYQEIKNVQLRLNNQPLIDASHEFLVYNQPIQNHTNIPSQPEMKYRYKHNEFIPFKFSSEFGMYSFALEPEKHYPTGQINMSRISHQQLSVEIDPEIYYVYSSRLFNSAYDHASDGTIPVILKFATGRLSPGVRAYVRSKDNKFRVYALSYNVLRIQSGLAGLKF